LLVLDVLQVLKLVQQHVPAHNDNTVTTARICQ
jgi:hypothetical protein